MMSASPSGGTAWLESEIRERHSFLSFQQPDKIADAIRLFSGVRLWSEVAARLGHDESSTKATLRLIVDRRNKIAHEADIDPSFPGSRWPIGEADAAQCKDFLSGLVEAIHATLS
ncbi:HEPN domain-containing protein [Ralstonia syzygii subsp. celebesensis]|uniref:HEPN domain-containing protein n=2 Tax=Ralstonia syzygii TaxID=28097 RepID=UPI0012FE242D|nr:HEPN domain-containing protein [Ralstonia syzygii]QQV55813.1 hypothetical protein JK151_01705 [Ralstonia syzygii subsp. celebesensis]